MITVQNLNSDYQIFHIYYDKRLVSKIYHSVKEVWLSLILGGAMFSLYTYLPTHLLPG